MTDSAILKKLKKLLALSECKTGNLSEKAAAAERAAALMAEHKISMAEVMTAEESVEADPIGARLVHECGKTCAWRAILLDGLCKANSCLCLVNVKGMSVAGQESNTQAVSYLFKMFEADVNRLCEEWANQRWCRPGQSARRSFRIGAAEVLRERLIEAKRRAMRSATQTALVRLDSIEKKIIETLKISGRQKDFSATTDDKARFEGNIAGSSIKIDQPGKSLEAKKAELGSGR